MRLGNPKKFNNKNVKLIKFEALLIFGKIEYSNY
jgi:hypothetical protein